MNEEKLKREPDLTNTLHGVWSIFLYLLDALVGVNVVEPGEGVVVEQQGRRVQYKLRGRPR